MDVQQFTCSPFDGHLGCFQFWVIMNKAVLNIHVQFLSGHVFSSLAYVPKSGIAESYHNCICNLLRNHQNVFYSSCTLLYSH